MKPLLIITFLYFHFSAVSQLLEKTDIIRYKIKTITQKNNFDNTTFYSEYNNKGLIIKETTTPHFILPNSEQIIFYNYQRDSLLSSVITILRQRNTLMNSDTTYYQYDNLGRLEYESTSELLIKYVYLQGVGNEKSREIWQKKTYWTDSTKINGKKVCDFVFKNGKRYFLRNYEMYSYSLDQNIPTVIYSLEKCESNQDKTNQTFCLYQSQQTIKFGDSLTQYVTLNANISDNISKENTFTCDQVEVFLGGPSIDRIETRKFQNNKIYQTIVGQYGREPYSNVMNYFYNENGLLEKIVKNMTTNHFGKNQKSETTFNFSYSFY